MKCTTCALGWPTIAYDHHAFHVLSQFLGTAAQFVSVVVCNDSYLPVSMVNETGLHSGVHVPTKSHLQFQELIEIVRILEGEYARGNLPPHYVFYDMMKRVNNAKLIGKIVPPTLVEELAAFYALNGHHGLVDYCKYRLG